MKHFPNPSSPAHDPIGPRSGGLALILATLLFAAVFGYLASRLGYPQVLDLPAEAVLPRLLELGTTGRLVWLVYGLVPLLLVPTALGVRAAAPQSAASRAALAMAVLAAVAMSAGLLRWPTLNWQLAQDWGHAGPEARAAMSATFSQGNRVLGNWIGEFFGELFLNGFFLCAAWALGRARQVKWLPWLGTAAAVLGWLAMLRNVTPAVHTLAELNNSVLPLWMLVQGVVLLRWRGQDQLASGSPT